MNVDGKLVCEHDGCDFVTDSTMQYSRHFRSNPSHRSAEQVLRYKRDRRNTLKNRIDRVDKQNRKDRKEYKALVAEFGEPGTHILRRPKKAKPETRENYRAVNKAIADSIAPGSPSKFCPRCGTPNSAGHAFCPYDGEPL